MSLNYSIIPLLVGDNVRTVGVRFFSDADGVVRGKVYVYLTTFNFEKGDLAVVFVGNTPKVVEVKELDPPTKDDIDYKWLVCPVDTSTYLANLETAQELAQKIKNLEQDSQRKQILSALGALEDPGVKKLEFK